MAGDDDSDDWADYESGPFCRHWGDIGDCDDLCACGHSCGRHSGDDCEDCPCEKFEDAPDPPADTPAG